jgi:hypothetical protein
VIDKVFTPDCGMVVSSFSGAMVYALTIRQTGKKRMLYFIISFSMGIIGADVTLDLIYEFLPAVYTDQRAVGAFLCSALVVSLILYAIRKIEHLSGVNEKSNKNI